MIEDKIDSHLRDWQGKIFQIRAQVITIGQLEEQISECEDLIMAFEDEVDLIKQHLEDLGWDGSK